MEIFCSHFFKTCIDQKKMHAIKNPLGDRLFVGRAGQKFLGGPRGAQDF